MRGEKTLGLFFKGLCMGSADIIPGISGGTVALILGIYEELIHSIKTVDLRVIPYAFFAIFRRDYREGFKKIFLSIRFDFLVPLVTGIATAFILLSRIINNLLINYRSLVYSFFLGLILASAVIVYMRIGKFKPINLFFILAGLVSAYLFLSSTGLYLDHSLPVIFISGILSICAMILPGISGAFIMVFLNQYEYMIAAIKSFYLPPIITYLVGAFFGIIAFSHLLSKLLKKARDAVLSFLVGLMLGGLKIPISRIEAIDISTVTPFLIGLTLVISVEIYANRRNRAWTRS
ncbi:MAG TPA: DUF368 domain-containing protein [Thermoplasmatales archaeon]|nr:DUF368 domain-containing protein [Thermoplasmatales archaeon]